MVRVMLTFDDGPSQWTGAILDALAEFDSRATFFVLGERVYNHPHLITRMLEEGHEVGIHGWSHTSWPYLSQGALAFEITDTRKAVQAFDPNFFTSARWKPKWCRPPHHAKTPEIEELVKHLGLQIVGTSLDPGDWFKDAAGIEEHIRRDLHPNANIDLHDAVAPGELGTRDGTVTAVRNLLADGTIRSVTLTEAAA